MGKKISYTNTSDGIEHVGNKTLYPNDTREVDIDHLTHEQRQIFLGEAVEEEEPKADPLLALLDLPIKKLADAIAEINPDGSHAVTTDQLTLLAEAEQNGKTRAGAMEAIAEEQLFRANESQDIAQLAAELPDMSEDDLNATVDLYKDDAGKMALINEELEKRALANPQ